MKRYSRSNNTNELIGPVLAVLGGVGLLIWLCWMCWDFYHPKTATWRNTCVASHTEVAYLPVSSCTTGSNGSQSCTTRIEPQYNTVCDRYEWKCLPGRDKTTVCLKAAPGSNW